MRSVRKLQLGAEGRHDDQRRAGGAGATSVRVVMARGWQERVQPAAETRHARDPVFQKGSQNPGTHVQTAPATHVRRVPQEA